ncbi:MAG TPA: adenylate/guanylate cyclase domain-containing protein [Stellaceae bacterium]|nr:adenylate/guanylate cyclase domain-containing protein [Stellaceae bacterium]
MSAPRKLAAILAADVVGYSRLTAADEEGTIARLKALRRELIDPSIAAHRGRIVKTTGDGMLVEFASVVDAVRNAVESQLGMAERNRPFPPEQRIEFRVGINLGDVVVEGDDLLGDGVNVAARLEGIAPPGGIVLSLAAWQQVEGKIDLAVEDLGEQNLKNIVRPVRACRIVLGAPGPANAAPASPAAPRLSIVVLPFASMSDNAAEDYFADGITEDITTDLSRIPDSFVIARNTAFTYKGKSADAKQVGRELGVRYVLEGSVRRSGSRVRANVQLIDAESGAHLFAERFDCDRADLMDLQDETTARIAGAIGAQLIDAESRRSLKERPTNPDAVDLTMRGWSVLHRAPSRESLAEARALFERALALDDRATDAVIGLAYSYARAVNSGFTETRDVDLARATELVARALRFTPERATAHWVHGVVLRALKRFDEAAAAFEQAIALDRNFAPAYGSLGDLVTWLGRPEETIRLNEQAMRLSPRDPLVGNWQFDIGVAHFYMRDDEQTVKWLLRARTSNPQLPLVPALLAGVLAHQGKLDLAQAELTKALQLSPWVTSIASIRRVMPATDPQMRARDEEYLSTLRLLGMPDE